MGPERIMSGGLPDDLRLAAAYLYGNRMENMGEAVVAAGETISRLMAEQDALLGACRKFLAVRANYGRGFDDPFDHDEGFGDAMLAIEAAVAKATGKDGQS